MEQVDLLSTLLEENYEHARLHEEHRASSTNFVMAIAAGLLAVASQATTSPWAAIFFGALTVAVGVVGAMLVLKHFERYRYQLKVASVLRDEIEKVIRDKGCSARPYEELLSLAQQLHHDQKLFRKPSSEEVKAPTPDRYLKGMRLFLLYLSINFVVIGAGIIFILLVLLRKTHH
jgi:hypothetical protein